jgi:hypothetical protein
MGSRNWRFDFCMDGSITCKCCLFVLCDQDRFMLFTLLCTENQGPSFRAWTGGDWIYDDVHCTFIEVGGSARHFCDQTAATKKETCDVEVY